ncbi:MAG: hypothetical protein LAO56_09300 [Acidobacteriia bacterium]|nr:hypothetical protein [Terriglobia bacterium]
MSESDLQALEYLVARDQLRPLSGLATTALLHNDHRWVLVILAWAQENKILPRPCDLVMLDYHSDGNPSIALDSEDGLAAIAQCRRTGSIADAIVLCDKHLRPDDGDWVKAGMEIGSIRHTVAFGVETREKDTIYTDRADQQHQFWVISHIGDALAWQGRLSDAHYRSSYQPLWDILAWDPPNFTRADRHLAFSIDLDYFAVHAGYLDCTFPWPQAVYERQFSSPSIAPTTRGYTAQTFLNGILSQSALVTIAREPAYCGGEAECDQIFGDVNRWLFGNAISITR